MDHDIDQSVCAQFLDFALLHSNAQNHWAEGYWLGRAVQHAEQNAVDRDWMISECDRRGIDAAVFAMPKPGDPISTSRWN